MKVFFTVACLFFLLLPRIEAKAVVIIANKSANIEKISKDDLKKIYLGRKKKLSGIDIKPMDFVDGHKLSKSFRKRILRKNPAQYRQYWARLLFTGKAKPPTASIEEETDMIDYVKDNERAIGYILKKPLPDGVKAILELDL